jgi:hypothetical protein
LYLAFALALGMSGIANAGGPFGLIKRQPVRSVATVANHAVHGAISGASNGIAQAKANQQANEGRMRHVGGSFGNGRYEGVGFSTVSADDAIRKCCYWNQRTPVEIGVARGNGGWFATVIYR